MSSEHVLQRLANQIRGWVIRIRHVRFSGEVRTGWRLLLRGFLWRREPSFVDGRRPDYFTFLRGQMWVEVKEIEPPASHLLLYHAKTELSARLDGAQGNYGAQAWVTRDFDAGKAKNAVNLLKRELADGLDLNEHLIIAIPPGSGKRAGLQARWTSARGKKCRLVTLENDGELYGCPAFAEPADWLDVVEIVDSAGDRQAEAYKVLSDGADNALTICVVPTEKYVGLSGVGSAESTKLNTVDRLRRAIENAAGQLKSGQSHRTGPGVVEIYNDHLPAHRDDILTACFGDLNASFDPATRHVSQFYGLNGVFRPNKNRSVSAVVYRSRLFNDVSVLNTNARHPIAERWLDGQILD